MNLKKSSKTNSPSKSFIKYNGIANAIKEPSLPIRNNEEIQVIRQQRDELRIRIQHLLHLLNESESILSEQSKEISVLKHAMVDHETHILERERDKTPTLVKRDVDMTADITTDSHAFLLEAKVESLESELSAYKATCIQLDRQIFDLKNELKNEQNQSMKWKEMLNQQTLQIQPINYSKCIECQKPFLQGDLQGNETSEIQIQEDEPRKTIYKTESKSLIYEESTPKTDLKWMNMEQSPIPLNIMNDVQMNEMQSSTRALEQESTFESFIPFNQENENTQVLPKSLDPLFTFPIVPVPLEVVEYTQEETKEETKETIKESSSIQDERNLTLMIEKLSEPILIEQDSNQFESLDIPIATQDKIQDDQLTESIQDTELSFMNENENWNIQSQIIPLQDPLFISPLKPENPQPMNTVLEEQFKQALEKDDVNQIQEKIENTTLPNEENLTLMIEKLLEPDSIMQDIKPKNTSRMSILKQIENVKIPSVYNTISLPVTNERNVSQQSVSSLAGSLLNMNTIPEVDSNSSSNPEILFNSLGKSNDKTRQPLRIQTRDIARESIASNTSNDNRRKTLFQSEPISRDQSVDDLLGSLLDISMIESNALNKSNSRISKKKDIQTESSSNMVNASKSSVASSTSRPRAPIAEKIPKIRSSRIIPSSPTRSEATSPTIHTIPEASRESIFRSRSISPSNAPRRSIFADSIPKTVTDSMGTRRSLSIPKTVTDSMGTRRSLSITKTATDSLSTRRSLTRPISPSFYEADFESLTLSK